MKTNKTVTDLAINGNLKGLRSGHPTKPNGTFTRSYLALYTRVSLRAIFSRLFNSLRCGVEETYNAEHPQPDPRFQGEDVIINPVIETPLSTYLVYHISFARRASTTTIASSAQVHECIMCATIRHLGNNTLAPTEAYLCLVLILYSRPWQKAHLWYLQRINVPM